MSKGWFVYNPIGRTSTSESIGRGDYIFQTISVHIIILISQMFITNISKKYGGDYRGLIFLVTIVYSVLWYLQNMVYITMKRLNSLGISNVYGYIMFFPVLGIMSWVALCFMRSRDK